MRTRLQARERELLADLRQAEADALESNTGDVEDAVDRVTSGEAREGILRLENRDYRELDEVRDALARLDDGSFGKCEACGREIEPERLAAIPWTRFCAADARQREHFTSPGTL